MVVGDDQICDQVAVATVTVPFKPVLPDAIPGVPVSTRRCCQRHTDGVAQDFPTALIVYDEDADAT
jgi:hypothetical protein